MTEDLTQYFLREDVSWRDKCAQAIEEMSQREIRQLAEYCIDHLEKKEETNAISDYLIIRRASNA